MTVGRIELPLDRHSVSAGAVAEVDSQGTLWLQIPPIPGSYGLVWDELTDLVGIDRSMLAPAVLEIEVLVVRGRVGIAVFDAGLREPVSEEVSVSPSERPRTVSLYVAGVDAGARLMFRNFACADASPRVQIRSVAYRPARGLTAAELKRIRAAACGHVYYTVDLGDGVVLRATLADEEGFMRKVRAQQAVAMWLLEDAFGSLAGRSVLDVACSAGYRSFYFARQGARTTAVDWDAGAIRQARFVQECIGADFAHQIDFRHADLFSFEPARPFDLVFCSGLFYHLSDPIGAARRVFAMCAEGALIYSCVASREDDVYELSNPERYPFCAAWEFALVPSPGMLKKTFEHAGFATVEMHQVADFRFDATSGEVAFEPVPRISGEPVFLVCRK